VQSEKSSPNKNGSKQDRKLSGRVIRGGLWVFLLRGTRRIFDFARTLILARFLSPNDFGLMGIALISLQALETLSQTGFQTALVQKKGDVKEYLDVTWTFLFLRGVGLFFLMSLAAPFVAEFFNSPRARFVIQFLALSLLFQGLVNIRIVLFQKELIFRKQFLFEFSGFMADFVVSLSLVLVFQNVWVLVAGKIAGDITKIIASYALDFYAPAIKFNLTKTKELYQFGRWITVANMLVFLVTECDNIVVGKLFGAIQLGFYRLASTIGNLPTTEITHVVSQVTLPAYSKLQDEREKIKEMFFRTLHFTTIVSFMISSLITALIYQFTSIFLGEKWLPIVMIAHVIVIAGLVRSIQAVTGPVFIALGKPKIETICQVVRFSVLIMLIYPLSRKYGIMGVPLSVLLSILITAILSCVLVTRVLRGEAKQLVRIILVPLLSFVGVLGVVVLFKLYVSVNTVWEFILAVVCGIGTYCGIIFVFERTKVRGYIVDTIKEVVDRRL
jgi:lipopolysaccharide exporter